MDKKTKQLILDLFDDSSIGVDGNRNDYGADSYHCPSCGASEKIKGNASSFGHIDLITHNSTCKLMELKRLAESV